MKKVLIMETIPAQPHLETAGEIALRHRCAGDEVRFAWLGDDLVWSDWNLPLHYRLLGSSYSRRLVRYFRLLEANGVGVCTECPEVPQNVIDRWSLEFSGDLSDLKKYNYNDLTIGMGVASSLISKTGNPELKLDDNISVVRLALNSALTTYFRSQFHIHSYSPDLIYTFNGRFATSRPIVLAGQQAGVQVLRHERGSTFNKFDVFENSIHDFKYMQQRIREHWRNSVDQDREKIANEFYLRRRNGDGIGWLSFTDFQRKKYINEVNHRNRGSKLRVVYFTSSEDEFSAVSDSISLGAWPRQINAVRDIVTICNHFGFDLTIRVHPHLRRKAEGQRRKWLELAGPSVHVIDAFDATDSYALLDSADIVVSYGSTIGIEAAYWMKPTILVGAAAYSNCGVNYEPKSFDELKACIGLGNLLMPRESDFIKMYGYYYLTFGQNYQFYRPQSLFSGRMLGQNLSVHSFIVNLLKATANFVGTKK